MNDVLLAIHYGLCYSVDDIILTHFVLQSMGSGWSFSTLISGVLFLLLGDIPRQYKNLFIFITWAIYQ